MCTRQDALAFQGVTHSVCTLEFNMHNDTWQHAVQPGRYKTCLLSRNSTIGCCLSLWQRFGNFRKVSSCWSWGETHGGKIVNQLNQGMRRMKAMELPPTEVQRTSFTLAWLPAFVPVAGLRPPKASQLCRWLCAERMRRIGRQHEFARLEMTNIVVSKPSCIPFFSQFSCSSWSRSELLASGSGN